MLPRAVRSKCWRPALYAHPRPAGRFSSTRPIPSQLRTFSFSATLRNQSTNNKDPLSKNDAIATTPPSQPEIANASVVPQLEAEAKVQVPQKELPKKELLNEGAIANKDQRKADWAIMREMAKYLWPKVMLSGDVQVGSTDHTGRMIGVQNFGLERLYRCWWDPR